jgi:hypothetical protein
MFEAKQTSHQPSHGETSKVEDDVHGELSSQGDQSITTSFGGTQTDYLAAQSSGTAHSAPSDRSDHPRSDGAE